MSIEAESKSIKIIGSNKSAFHEYEILEKYEAGLELQGTEVKSLRNGKVNLSDGWVGFSPKGEAWLKQVHISPYSHGNQFNHHENRERRLLLHKVELAKLMNAVEKKGLTVVPLKIYFKGGWVKVEVAVGRGKKLHDKRADSREKTEKRELARVFRGRGS